MSDASEARARIEARQEAIEQRNRDIEFSRGLSRTTAALKLGARRLEASAARSEKSAAARGRAKCKNWCKMGSPAPSDPSLPRTPPYCAGFTCEELLAELPATDTPADMKKWYIIGGITGAVALVVVTVLITRSTARPSEA